MIVTEKNFESFKWIDIENPNKNDLEKITSQYHLNYYLIKDSLEKGGVKITVYPDIKAVTKKGNKGVSNTDGIHYTPNGSTQWGSKVVEIIKTLPLVSNTKGTIAAPTVVPNPPPKIEKPKSIIKNQSPPNPESSAGSI